MPTGRTTISCRAFALCGVLLACVATRSAGADKPLPPKLPLAAFWSVDLGAEASAPPVSDGDRVFVALKSAHLIARSVTDGHELWRIAKDVTVPMAADAGLVFVSAGEAVEALRGVDGGNAWMAPRIKTVAPLLTGAGRVIAVTDAEVIAIRSTNGEIVWRHAAGGVHLSPAIDGDRVLVGADDGRVLALTLASGAMAWEKFVPDGVTALAAHNGLAYVGAGDKVLYCLDGRNGDTKWTFPIRSVATGHIAVDDKRVYFGALDNVIRGLDRSSGNQRWQASVRRRATAGVFVVGHIVFVPVAGSELVMIYDKDGRLSGNIRLPGEIARDVPPDIRETPAGPNIFVVTGGLSNEWRLTYIAPVAESTIIPLSEMTTMPGLGVLTDPVAEPIGKVLGLLVLDDPTLQPASLLTWPVFLTDPPLVPLTTIPGIQLRPLSTQLPIRRGA